MKQAPPSWVKQVSVAVTSLQKVPLWGFPPLFPVEAFAERLSSALHMPQIQIHCEPTEWRPAGDLLTGLGNRPLLFGIELTPLTGRAYWAMASEDIARITAYALHPPQSAKGFIDKGLQEGFYEYLLLEALDAAYQVYAFQDLTPKIHPVSRIPSEAALCIDVRIDLEKHAVWGRILCPETFHSAFTTHFGQRTETLSLSALAQDVPIALKVVLGHATLSAHEWAKVKIGDLLVLNRCTYDPKGQKGSAIGRA